MERGWSQRRLADKLNDASGHPTNTRHDVYRWESGKRSPRSWLPVLAEVFAFPLETFELASAVREAVKQAPTLAMEVDPRTIGGGAGGPSPFPVELSLNELFTVFSEGSLRLDKVIDPAEGADGEIVRRRALLTASDEILRRLIPVDVRHEDVWATLDLAASAPVDATHSLDLTRAETIIHTMCAQAVVETLGSTNPAHAPAEPTVLSGVLRHEDRTLLLKIRPDLHTEQLLHVAIQDPREIYLDSPAVYEHHDIRLPDSVGRHTTVRITLPNDLSQVIQRAIADNVNRILISGYGWLNDRLQQAMCQVTGAVEQDCLQLFRQVCRRSGSFELEREIWLVKMVKDRVAYAVDPEVAGRVLAAGRHYHALQQAPAAIATALLANSIPFARSFSRQAIGAQSTVPMSLSSTPYEEINKDFLLAQGAIYADQMLLSPLAGGDRHGWLLAAYPASVSASARTVIEQLRPMLGSYLSHSRHAMQDPVIRPRCEEGESSDDGA
jgi:hypothetical protein